MTKRTGCIVLAWTVTSALLYLGGCSGQAEPGPDTPQAPRTDQAGPGPDTPQAPRSDCWGEASGGDGCAPIPLPDATDQAEPGPDTPQAPRTDQAEPGPDTPQAPRTDCWGDVPGSDCFAPIPLPDATDTSDQADPGFDTSAPSEVEVSETSDVCVPACEGKECGDDGCGGECGTCGAMSVCQGEKCVAVECWDGNDIPWDGCDAGKIAEFKVNEFWVGPQAHPAVASRPGGSFAVAWEGKGEGESNGVWLRFFGAGGEAKKPETLVNEVTLGDQERPSVAVLEGGHVVVAWNGFGDEDTHGIYMRRYGKDGMPVGPQEIVNTFTTKTQESAHVTALDGGGFVVTWASLGKILYNHEVCARIYQADGTPVDDEWIVNLEQDNDQQSPVMAATPGGGFAAVWTGKPQDGSGYGIFARMFDAAGVPQNDDTLVNTYTFGMQWTPWIAALAGGGYAVAWDGEGAHDDWGVSGRLLDEAGTPASDELAINTVIEADQYGPRIAGLVDGRFVVAWESFTEAYIDPDAEGDVFMRIYAADATPLTSAGTPINHWTYDGQGDPSVAAFEDGGWIVVWYSFAQDGDERGIFAQRFDADGKKITLW
ncbi:MAG: hypothetical protein FJ109_13330 [Deltaproteobacteria bacterium]|nr:hypothetical protein [Deltaproteobacteria bacterium]